MVDKNFLNFKLIPNHEICILISFVLLVIAMILSIFFNLLLIGPAMKKSGFDTLFDPRNIKSDDFILPCKEANISLKKLYLLKEHVISFEQVSLKNIF